MANSLQLDYLPLSMGLGFYVQVWLVTCLDI